MFSKILWIIDTETFMCPTEIEKEGRFDVGTNIN